MQDRRLKHGEVADAAVGGDQRRDLDRMVDVRSLVAPFASLIAMLVGGKGDGSQEFGGVGRQWIGGLVDESCPSQLISKDR
jgi:hypothetical protein